MYFPYSFSTSFSNRFLISSGFALKRRCKVHWWTTSFANDLYAKDFLAFNIRTIAASIWYGSEMAIQKRRENKTVPMSTRKSTPIALAFLFSILIWTVLILRHFLDVFGHFSTMHFLHLFLIPRRFPFLRISKRGCQPLPAGYDSYFIFFIILN